MRSGNFLVSLFVGLMFGHMIASAGETTTVNTEALRQVIRGAIERCFEGYGEDLGKKVELCNKLDPIMTHEILMGFAKTGNYDMKRIIAWNCHLSEALELFARDKDPNARRLAAQGSETSTSTLVMLASDTDPGVVKHVASNDRTPAEILSRLSQSADWEVRRGVAGNLGTPAIVLARLANDENRYVRASIAENPNTAPEVLARLARDSYTEVKCEVAKNSHTPPGVLGLMAQDPSVGEFEVELIHWNKNTPTWALQILTTNNDPDIARDAKEELSRRKK